MSDEASGTSMDEEMGTLNKNWEFVLTFLKELKERERTEDGVVKEFISKVNSELDIYVAENKGAKPKVREYKENSISGTGDSTRFGKDILSGGGAVGKKISIKKEESDSSNEYVDSYQEFSKKKRSKRGQLDNYKSDRLGSLFDNRLVPELESFAESGLDLEAYLTVFEDYYRENYRGGSYLWVKQLERQLTGRMLEGFRMLRQAGDSYEEVRDKLLAWYEGEKELRKEEA